MSLELLGMLAVIAVGMFIYTVTKTFIKIEDMKTEEPNHE